jgi:hypothetical protein
MDSRLTLMIPMKYEAIFSYNSSMCESPSLVTLPNVEFPIGEHIFNVSHLDEAIDTNTQPKRMMAFGNTQRAINYHELPPSKNCTTSIYSMT